MVYLTLHVCWEHTHTHTHTAHTHTSFSTVLGLESLPPSVRAITTAGSKKKGFRPYRRGGERGGMKREERRERERRKERGEEGEGKEDGERGGGGQEREDKN